MSDILKYRIPEKEIVQLTGLFKRVASFENIEGFIISTFDKTERFHFIKSNSAEDVSDSKDIPFCISKETYLEIGRDFLNSIKSNNISKAILSRVKKVNLEIELSDFFNRLCVIYPNAFVYIVSSPLFGTWIGASPEVLIEANGQTAKTMALAGTLADNEKNWGNKEKIEQNLVNDFILRQLQGLNVSNLQIEEQKEVQAGPVKHLKSSFEFQLNGNSPIGIAENLHPTPAVSGFPQLEAMKLIRNTEKHKRKLYAGMIGLITSATTNIYVNLRCAEIINNNAFLYLGGGYTKDSIVESEWNETENKAKTLLNVINNKA